jgi:cytochrome c-type biogenesis protein CcmH/NrfF
LRLKTSFMLLLLAAIATSQTPQIESSDVERVGAHIACQCGGCKESVSCPMAKRGCSFCVPAKAKIYKMQSAGMSDSAIIDIYKKEFGDKVYLADPSSFFWLTPTFVIILGVLGIFYFVRRNQRGTLVAVPAGHDASLDKYRDEIDREMNKW